MILLTGGSGLLGKELIKLIPYCYVPSHKDLDICSSNYPSIPKSTNLIIHCAAYTDVVGAETNKQLCYDTNVIGTRRMVNMEIPIVYISTEYVFDGERGNYNETDYPNPINFYGLTKLLGEKEIKNGLIIRTLFKPRPFEHEFACINQWTSGEYVDIIAKEITIAIKNWQKLPNIIHIGTKKKCIYDLAKQTRKVIPITREHITTVKLPRDTSLNTTLWEEFKCR